MVAIPQITRDKLASSVVGTPALDTSGQEIGNSFAKMGAEVGQAVGEYAIERQQQVDSAETNRLFTQYKLNTFSSLESIKQQYANDPEKSTDALVQSMQQHLDDTTKAASNPRVGLMVGRGDPQFDGLLIRDQQKWALSQREQLDKQAIMQQGNQLADKAEALGADTNTPYVLKKQNLLPLFSAAGNLTAGAFSAAHPDSAMELSQRIGPTIMTRAIYGMMQANPAQAVTFTQEPEVKKAFESNPKELDTLQRTALERLKGLGNEEKWKQIAAPLVDSPDVIRDVASGKVDWTQLDRAPQSPLTDQLKKMALDISPKNVEEQQQAVADFFAEAHSIGLNLRKGEEKPEASVSKLMDFSTKLAKAYNDGSISKGTYMSMNRQLAEPLIGAVMKAHDPSWFEQAKNKLGSWVSQSPEKPEDVVDKYTAGYNVINNWLKTQGKSDDWRYKAGVIQKYLDFSNTLGPNDRDAQGRPYTAQSVAQKVLGISVGDIITTPLGPLPIKGHKSDGTPIFELSKELQKKFDHLKLVKGE